MGFTVTGKTRNGKMDPKIQIWRENKAQCGTYYKPVADIVIESTSCNNFTTLSDPSQAAKTYLCSLKTSAVVSVQIGDILGIELPPRNDSDFELYFTIGGTMNYIFQQQLSSTVQLAMRVRVSVSEDLPQIKLDVLSGESINYKANHY